MTRNLSIMAGLIALTACGQKVPVDTHQGPINISANDTPTNLGILNVGASETPSGICDGSRLGKPLILKLDKQLLKQLSGRDQEIARHVSRGGNDLPDPPVLQGSILYPTNLDLQADSGGLVVGNNYVEINIVLESADFKKRDLIFLRPSAANDPTTDLNAAAAITVRKGDQSNFCFLDRNAQGDPQIIRDSTNQVETIRLGSKLKRYEESSISIGVRVTNLKNNKRSTPIYIDPNVRNTG